MDSDPINKASHYNSGKIEVIDALEDWGLDKNFCLGNSVKYIARHGKKPGADPIEDLKKAAYYLNREIKKMERARAEEENDQEGPAQVDHAEAFRIRDRRSK